ncbi:MAG: HAD-IA family hydrolase [Motiliproteus sp.]
MIHQHPAAILFDLDGTLLDTAPDFFRILNQMRAEQQLIGIDYEPVRQQVSNGAAAMIRTAFNIDNNHPDFGQLQQTLLDRYQQSPVQDSALFNGMPELLDWLEQHQIHWGIVTNKPERFCNPILEALQLQQRCAILICPDHTEHRKPHPEGLLKACSKLGIQPQQCIYVGDHRRDIEAGINANMTTVAALYGYIDQQDPPKKWQADLQIQSPSELLNWLKERTDCQQSTE